MRNKLTILDIARLAGVSKATVSRVLNNRAQVDPGLRERVLRVIEEHKFVPSINATALNGYSRLIGILVPRYIWLALQEITWSIAEYVNIHSHYEVILYSTNEEEGYNHVIEQILDTKLVGGVIATLYNQPVDHLSKLYRQGLPVVLVDTIGIASELPTIGADHYGGAYQAVRHLLELGHRRIGYIHGPDRFLCSRERYQAYLTALHEFNVEAHPHYFQQGDFGPNSAEQAMQYFWQLPQPPTAIFACNDGMAYGVLRAAQNLHIRVPDELSVVGFNDDPVPATHLTTVHQPFMEMGRCAVELLISMMQSEYTFSSDWQNIVATTSSHIHVQTNKDLVMPLQMKLPTHLVERKTCSAVV